MVMNGSSARGGATRHTRHDPDILPTDPTRTAPTSMPAGPVDEGNNRETESGRVQAMRPEPPEPSLPARLSEFHLRLPLAGDPPNALLGLPDDRLLSLAAVLRDTPKPAPDLSLDKWRAFRDAMTPHGVFPLLAYRLRSWPEDCQQLSPSGVPGRTRGPGTHSSGARRGRHRWSGARP